MQILTIHLPFSSCLVFEGYCPKTSSSLAPLGPDTTNWSFQSIFLVPLSEFQPEWYFFPSNRIRYQEMYLVEDSLRLNMPGNRGCEPDSAVYFQNNTPPYLAILLNRKVFCKSKSGFVLKIFSSPKLLLVWGCVDLKPKQMWDESVWLLGHKLYKSESDPSYSEEILNMSKAWAVEKLQNISNIGEADLVLVDKENHTIKMTNAEFCKEYQCPIEHLIDDNSSFILYFGLWIGIHICLCAYCILRGKSF